ncbi:MAG TPA: hypothetical protein PLE24_16385 [Chitinispirillaceae bacterium]|jgi:hypothetical protein|nr:hypothetical protein [Chitinispirillaceae bacterium]
MMNTDTRKIFRLQRRFLYTEVIFTAVVAGVFVLSWIPSLLSFVTYGIIIGSALRAAIYLNSTIAALLFFMFFLKRELRRVEYIVTDDRIIRKSPYRISLIRFTDVLRINFIKIFPSKGFLVLYSNDGSIKVPLYLEELDIFLETLRKNLEVSGKASVLDLTGFRKAEGKSAVYMKAYRRSLDAFFPLIGFSFLVFAANFLIAEEFWGMDMVRQLFWAVIGLFFPVCAYAVYDWHLNHMSSSDASVNDSLISDNGRGWYYYYVFFSLVCYFLSGIFFRFVFQV